MRSQRDLLFSAVAGVAEKKPAAKDHPITEGPATMLDPYGAGVE
ncbi:hypothetical protein MMMB2_1444 [Mycobacterium marinum MB2]|nr:hypothetical protein MMSP_3160 [Mycobacterium sp. 012931]EPQ76783.1 hypothetical protein MMMB2_1444 [Mycobacterium marinum MB2]